MSKAKTIMSKSVITLGPDDAVEEAVERLVAGRVSGATVVGETGRVLGVVSLHDLAKVRAGRGSSDEGIDYYLRWPPVSGRVWHIQEGTTPCVRDLMNAPITVEEETPLEDVASLMLRQHIHRVIVTDAERITGIISSLDFVRLYAGAPALAK